MQHFFLLSLLKLLVENHYAVFCGRVFSNSCLTSSTVPPSCSQVRGGQQGVFGRGADARRAGEGLGHVGRLPGEHLRQGPAAAPGRVGHHLLPARLPPPEREQVPQIPGQGDVGWDLFRLQNKKS